MGEYSKRIGDIGEQIVTDFLELVGWKDIQRNFDIPSVNAVKHGKNSHGIDGYFHYKSPMISHTLENVLISSKFSREKYRNDPIKQFKDYYNDLAMAIESFKKSVLRNSTLNKHNNIESTFDRGVLFWLNNVESDDIDLIAKLQRIDVPREFQHDGIILVDNKRMEFLFDAITYVNYKFKGAGIQFNYFNTGLNGDDQLAKNGLILPVQYFASNLLPFRAQRTGNDVTFVLCTKENFEEEELSKLMGLAKNIGANLQTNTVIAFPDYNKADHEHIVANTKQAFEESAFANAVVIENYNLSFRN